LSIPAGDPTITSANPEMIQVIHYTENMIDKYKLFIMQKADGIILQMLVH